MASDPSPASRAPALGVVHQRRLRALWRSAGWPCLDMVELELVAAGMLDRLRDAEGRETVRVSEAGVQWLAAGLQRHRAARDDHEALVERMARDMQRAGRLVWRGLGLRAPLADSQRAGSPRWALAMPDLFSIRHTSVEDYAEPVVHEIKVSRADLLSDLRRPAKGEAYLALAGQCWYVLRQGIAQAQDVPEQFGVVFASVDGGLDVARPAPRRPMRLPFATWMALARASPEPALDGEAQPELCDEAGMPDAPEQPARGGSRGDPAGGAGIDGCGA